MKYSREYLEQLSSTTGFRADTLEKVLRLERLLDQVTRHVYLGSRLVLKGGTDSFAQKALDTELAPMVRSGERPEIEVLKPSVEPLLTSLLTLAPAEREYVDRVQWGDFLPELVARDDPELLGRLRGHPALQWKVENARKRRP